jgi:hypothetical protein
VLWLHQAQELLRQTKQYAGAIDFVFVKITKIQISANQECNLLCVPITFAM